jgi:hypothetical protein
MTKINVPFDPPVELIEPGMRRFFNEQNLERYRKLASDVTTAEERRQVLELLAREMSTFRNEIGEALPVARRCEWVNGSDATV